MVSSTAVDAPGARAESCCAAADESLAMVTWRRRVVAVSRSGRVRYSTSGAATRPAPSRSTRFGRPAFQNAVGSAAELPREPRGPSKGPPKGPNKFQATSLKPRE